MGQSSDNFSDGNFTQNPAWNGDVSNFITNASNQLQSNGPNTTAIISLATPNILALNAEWTFYVEMNFNPSSSNYARVYLTADQQNLAGNLNGYYVQIGNRSDAIDLVKQSGTTNTRIIEGISNRVNTSAPKTRVKVTRDFEGNWTLAADTLGGTNYKPEGTGSDASFATSAFSGLSCIFTATRRQGFFFDDFEVKTANFQPPVPVNYKDVVITEIFPDESPRVDLPEKEFVEIFNRSTKDIKLGGFVFAD
ncbi:MAG: hypothetical protein H7Y04_11290, partial [Verrucomicrobia bacterium]|nr:hypothetical protein [Cytophagales bacterium]